MIDQLENHLRDALAARADDLPAGATQRLRSHDYRPRTRDLRPPVAAGALITAGAAAAAVLLVGLGPRTPEAFAGWTATPTPADSTQVNAAEAACRQRLAAEPTPPGAVSKTPLAPDETATPVLTDTRGPFTFVIFAGAHSGASCITGPDFTSLSSQHFSTATPTVPAGKVVVSQQLHTARAGYSFVEGHTGAGVTAITLILADGTRVQASSDNGWFVAWWPGTSDVTAADVTTAQGTTTQKFDTTSAPGCPQPPAGDHLTGCASGSGGQSGSVRSGSAVQSGSGGQSGSVSSIATGGN